MSDPILLEIHDGIALVTLNRPDKLNALNYASDRPPDGRCSTRSRPTPPCAR